MTQIGTTGNFIVWYIYYDTYVHISAARLSQRSINYFRTLFACITLASFNLDTLFFLLHARVTLRVPSQLDRAVCTIKSPLGLSCPLWPPGLWGSTMTIIVRDIKPPLPPIAVSGCRQKIDNSQMIHFRLWLSYVLAFGPLYAQCPRGWNMQREKGTGLAIVKLSSLALSPKALASRTAQSRFSLLLPSLFASLVVYYVGQKGSSEIYTYSRTRLPVRSICEGEHRE